jgi:hypothetical protein
MGGSGPGKDEAEPGQMSHVAFVHRFAKLGNVFAKRRAASPLTLDGNNDGASPYSLSGGAALGRTAQWKTPGG